MVQAKSCYTENRESCLLEFLLKRKQPHFRRTATKPIQIDIINIIQEEIQTYLGIFNDNQQSIKAAFHQKEIGIPPIILPPFPTNLLHGQFPIQVIQNPTRRKLILKAQQQQPPPGLPILMKVANQLSIFKPTLVPTQTKPQPGYASLKKQTKKSKAESQIIIRSH